MFGVVVVSRYHGNTEYIDACKLRHIMGGLLCRVDEIHSGNMSIIA